MLGFSQKEKDAVLRAALKSENRSAIKKALERGADPNGMMDEAKGQPFIVWAGDIYYGSESERAIEALLEAKADVNAKDASGNTALHRALYHRNSGGINQLLNAGADMFCKNNNGDTPFSLCMRYDSWHLCGKMIEKGALEEFKLRDPEPAAMLRLLTQAIDNGADVHYVIRPILKEITNINSEIDKGRSPLHTAVYRNMESLVNTLLERPEVNINQRDHRGATLLHIALANDHHDLARMLIERGADVVNVNKQGATALVPAAKSGNMQLARQVLRKLKEQKVTADLNDAMLAAAAQGNARMIEVLIAEGADKNGQNDKGETALILATKGKHMEAVKMLTVKHEVDTQIADNEGMIAYDHAVKINDKEPIEYLIKFQPGYEPPPPPPPPIDMGRFTKTSEHSIDVKEKGLTMTFNFWTQQVIYREPEKGQIAVVRNFDEIQRKEAIIEAFEILERLGGKPPAYQAVEAQKKSLGAAIQKPKNG